MVLKVTDAVIIGNALYAKQARYIEYNEVEEYKKILYKSLVEDYKYIMFESDESNIIEIEGKMFVKGSEGILSLSNLDDNFIIKLNSIYSKGVQDIINESRDNYINKSKRIVKKREFYKNVNNGMKKILK